MYRKYLKRVFDIVCALMAMIVFCWLYALIAGLVRTKLGSPVIFKQERPGLHGKIFTLYKFRTMTDKTDISGELLPDEVRLTKFGKFLRSTSLDELPEAWNILKGDMSMIGPRPLVIRYLPYYTEKERQRHSVRPGLSGLAQINGRNSLSWTERFQYDVCYVQNLSFKNDMVIVLQTIRKVFKREDILVGDQNIMLDLDKERGRADEPSPHGKASDIIS